MKPIIAALFCASALGVAAPVLAQPYPPRPEAAAPGHDLRGQLETLEGQIREGVRNRQLDQGEFDRATRELNSIRDQEQSLRAGGGGLSDVDRGMLQQRIDQLARSIHFMRDHGPTPGMNPLPVVAQPYPSRPDAGAPGHDLRGQLDTLESRVP